MKLFELFVNESGSIPDTGAIHVSEIEPTIQYLESQLSLDLSNHVLGSVGKKEFSGDIDIAVDLNGDEVKNLLMALHKIPDVSDIKKSNVISFKLKIQGYDETHETDRDRTGYVQVDFMIGDKDILKTYYHSPAAADSNYKGLHRTQLLMTIAAIHGRKDSSETTPDGRPLESERYMFSPQQGLVRVIRKPVPKQSGEGYTKKHINTIIDGPWKTADQVARQLGLKDGDNLDSYEALKDAVEKYYPRAEAKKIFADFAKNPVAQDM